MKLEAKIGLFVVMALGALLFLSTQVTSLGKWGRDAYRVHAYVADASGIEKHTNVLMNGVRIGEVEEIVIEGKKVKLGLSIDQGVQIPEDSSVIVAQESLLGSKVVNIAVGDSDVMVASGASLQEASRYASFEQTSDSVNAAAQELELLMHDFRTMLDEEHRRAIQEAIVAFRNVGVGLDGVVVDNRDDLREVIANLKSITVDLQQKLPEAVEKFVKIEENVTEILSENRTSLKDTISSAGDFFKSGEEAFGKVDTMLSTFSTSELQVAMHTDYMMRDGYGKVFLGINYLPNPDTYYMFDLISTDDYSEFATNPPAKHKESELYYSLQYGKRFDNLLLRFGAIESTGGAGFDYFMDHDRLKFSAEAFDFNAVNDSRSERAHLKAQVRYQLLKHLELYGGWDNFLNPRSQNLFIGAGLRFIDNDIKYTFGAASMAR